MVSGSQQVIFRQNFFHALTSKRKKNLKLTKLWMLLWFLWTFSVFYHWKQIFKISITVPFLGESTEHVVSHYLNLYLAAVIVITLITVIMVTKISAFRKENKPFFHSDTNFTSYPFHFKAIYKSWDIIITYSNVQQTDEIRDRNSFLC